MLQKVTDQFYLVFSLIILSFHEIYGTMVFLISRINTVECESDSESEAEVCSVKRGLDFLGNAKQALLRKSMY